MLYPIREIIPNPFPPMLVSNSKRLDFENRTKRAESIGSERNRPFGEKWDDPAARTVQSSNWKWLRILGLIANQIAWRNPGFGQSGGGCSQLPTRLPVIWRISG